MAHVAPEDAFEKLKARTAETIKSYFPIKGSKHTLEAKRVWVDDNKDVDDIRDQKEVKLKGRSWTVPIRAELELKDDKGKVVDRQVVSVAQLPKITRRYSYIVGGNEWQVNNLFRVKSGVYTKRRRNGELTSQWNLAKGQNFHMDFKPSTKKMSLRFGEANIPLYPVLKTMGVDDDTIERAWGKDILSANMASKDDVALRKFYRAMTGNSPETLDQVREHLREKFDNTVIRPDTTAVTLGTPYDKVTGKALLDGSHKILKVSRQDEEPDDRDSLEFKELHSAEDLINERLGDWKVVNNVTRKISNTLDKQKKIKNIVNPDLFGRPIRSFFVSSVLSENPEQTNPISFLAGNRKTTLFAPGEGGLSSTHQISIDTQSINPSHFGFLDPIQTPESDRIGITLQLASHVEKDGHDIKIPVYDVKNKKITKVSPTQAYKSNLAFPDQYNWKGTTPTPVGRYVKVSDKEGTFTAVKPSDVDYVIRSSKGMFDLPANMIPFLQSDQGNRTMVAAKQLEQAIALKHREAPKVQVQSDSSRLTFEKGLGNFVGHRAKVDGTVERIKQDGIIIKDSAGKRHEVQIYHDFPLNDDKSVISSTPLVSVGDKVSKGQVIADTNFTKDGTLALGTNLHVAYMPYKGYNFEDGIVISEGAAKKLTSEHMFRESVSEEKSIKLDKKKFLAYTAGKVTKDQAEKLDDSAVIKEGETVLKDDILVGVLKEENITEADKKLGLFDKSFLRPWKPREVRWTKDVPGTVTKVVKHGKKTTVYVKAEAPADVGDKIVGRHGNKGIITKVLPDHEMPQTMDGKPVEVLLNPTGIPSRINVGQVLETAASKIADKTGKPYTVNNFDPNIKDYTRSLQAELNKHGVSDTDDLLDPITKRKYPKVLNGSQYILKLHHTADKGLSARSRDAYDSNMLPASGGPKGGQTMDAMGLYALLAHDARENMKEIQTYKSDFNEDFWAKLQAGDPIPTPKVPFVFKKFEGYMKAMGLDVRKEGNNLILQPLLDKQVLEMSNGALPDAGRALRAKDAKEEDGGIFDPKITGGVKGKKWSHIPLPERMPNPVFETPITTLLDLNETSYKKVVSGEEELNGKTGPVAIVDALRKIDHKQMKSQLEKEIPTLRTSKLDKAYKKLKYLRALDRAGMDPKEAYTMKHLPVLPPQFRPITILDSGDINYDDVNRLYNHIGHIKSKFDDFDPALPPEEKIPLETSLYDGLKAVTLTGQVHQGRHRNGIIQTIASPPGKQPKEGFFQDKIIGRRQDLSLRGVIVPEPSMGFDEVGIPRKAAMDLYKPFVVRRLTMQSGGTGPSGRPFEAERLVKENHPAALAALEAELRERPIMLKRDPVLHKFGVQAFKPRLVEGKAVKIHPLATAGYNADFDGDKMSAFVPVSPKAVKEAYKMLPSNNLFNPSTGFLMAKPGQEALMGLYKLSEFGKKSGKRFKDPKEASLAVRNGDIEMDTLISLDNIGDADLFDDLVKQAAPVQTTVGRLMIYQSLPDDLKDKKILTDPNFVLDKKNLSNLLTDVAKKTPGDFGIVSDKFKDLGNEYATGMSISLDDFVSDTEFRDSVLREASKKESAIRSRAIPSNKKKDEIVKLYVDAANKITDVTKKKADNSKNRMYEWVKSGARGNWDQFKQMTVSPVLVADSRGDPVPIPIPKSYSEGLDIGSYMASMHGARMGTIGKVQGTQAPGKLSKRLINTTMNQLIVSENCGTDKGVVLDTSDRDVLDRFTARDISLGTKGGKDKGNIPAGTLVTSDVLNRLKNNKISKIEVRSPLKCIHGKGLCSTCYGVSETGQPYSPGTNVGVIAAQALGEPATQMAMNCNASGNLVTVRFNEKVQVLTFEQLWDSVSSYVDEDDGVQTKIPLGLEVWDHTRFVPVHVMQRHKPESPMVLVRTSFGHSFISQSTHPNWVRKVVVECKNCGCEEPVTFVGNHKSGEKTSVRCSSCRTTFTVLKDEYEDQQEFVVPSSDLLGLYIGVSQGPKLKKEDPISPLPPYLLGMALAEGSVRRLKNDSQPTPGMKRRQQAPFGTHWKVLGFAFTQNDSEIREEIKSRLEEAGLSYTEPSDKIIQINDVSLAREMWSLCGIGSSNKHLPSGWERASEEWLLEVLAGLIDGDGTKGERATATLYSTSWSLLSQVSSLVRILGGKAVPYASTNKELTRNQCYSLDIFLDKHLPSVKATDIKSPVCTKDVFYSKVVQVKEVMYDDWTYDLATSSRAFTANGVRTHNSFHTGGVVGAKGTQATSMFQKLEKLLNVSKTMSGSATLADIEGVVSKIESDKSAGGWRVQVKGPRGEVSHYVPSSLDLTVSKGTKVRAGDALTSGIKNPRDMLKRTNIGAVQKYLTDEIWDTYRSGGPVRRRNVETFVRAMTNLGVVTNPGDHDILLPGDRVAVSEIAAFNRSLEPGKKQVKFEPVLQGVEMLPLELQTDWIARLQSSRLKDTVLDAASEGWKSMIHGTHPIPGLAYGKEFGQGTAEAPWLY